MPRGVYIALPAYEGTVRVETAVSLTRSVSEIQSRGWATHIRTQVNCSILPLMRNQFVADFLRHEQFDDLVFLDHDVQWEPASLMRILDAPADFVAGIYPKRQLPIDFPIRPIEGAEVNEHGLLEVDAVPGGFLRLSRRCLQSMVDRYQSLSYKDTRIDTGRAWDLFGQMKIDGEYWGEDFSFCYRWRDMGGKIFTDPSLRFVHWGPYGFEGSLINTMVMPDGSSAVSPASESVSNVMPLSSAG